jgi:alkylresorcinol/alkylpyrone synthase
MQTILSLATAELSPTVSGSDTKAFLATILPPAVAGRLGRFVDASRIKYRQVLAPYDTLRQLATLDARNGLYLTHAAPLGERVAREALIRSGLQPHDVDVLIVTSSTGYAVPTLDQHLASRLGLRRDARCLFLSGLGCAGAVRAIGLAGDLLRACIASEHALVVSVELCSPWLQVGEQSPKDILSDIVFGDGAAAVVIGGPNSQKAYAVVADHGERWPGTLGARGATLTQSGFRHFRSPVLPRLLQANLPRAVEALLRKQGVATADLRFYAVNPSDHVVLETITAVLHIPDHLMQPAWSTWERHGNTLSAGPLYVLDSLNRLAPPASGDLGLVVVLGPGLTCDLMLLRWQSESLT